MKSADFQNQFSNGDKRAQVMAELADYCAINGLSYNQTDKSFRIDLPNTTEVLMHSHDKTKRTRKKFDISTWGPKGVDESVLPDDFQMPDTGEQLDEGQPPKGDNNAER